MIKTVMAILCGVIVAAGLNVEIVAGIRMDEAGNGKVIYDSEYEVDNSYDYIAYDPGKPGEEIVTVLIIREMPDDIIARFDF